MAKLIPARQGCLIRMTGGERRLSERLEQKLEDDYLCWYNVPVGVKQLHPDFVVLHPRRGIAVLEVKDWKLDSIQGIDRHSVRLLTAQGVKTVACPLAQARVYALEIAVALERDPLLRNPVGHSHANKLVMPYGWGVVFSNIARKQFEAAGLGEVLDPDRVICQDEMTESVNPEQFQQRLWNLFTYVFPCALSLPQVDRVRWHLFPEIRVAHDRGQFGLFENRDDATPTLQIPDLVRVMDLQQEQLARSLGDGHRVIHGVAGSGKTMILGYRCLHLAKASTRPILVLCYNVTLAARLRQLLEAQGLGEQVAVRNFHAWCREMLQTYSVELPESGMPADAYTRELVERTIAGVDRQQIPRGQYGAVLVDEGHDFAPDWLRLVVQMIDPNTNAMLLLYDDAQSIYAKGAKRRFCFASVGIQAQGRTTILRLNYRNTLEVLSVARTFAHSLLDPEVADDDGAPTVAPESAGRRGPLPELLTCRSLGEEADVIAHRIAEEAAHGRPLSEIAVICRTHFVGEAVGRRLAGAGIRYRSARRGSGTKQALFSEEPAVKLVSMHSSKGLEFATVYIPGVGLMPGKHGTDDEETRLLYVAMTRATDRVVMTHHQASPFSQRVRCAIEEVRQGLAA